MSFSTNVKEELCRGALSRKCCARAEAYGVLLFCHTFDTSGIKIVTGSPAFARRLPELFKRAFRVSFDRLPEAGSGKKTFQISAPEKLSAIRETYGSDPAGSLALHINYAVLEEEHCRTAFLRGAFLAGGSVSDPAKGYHLELVTSHYSVSRELAALLPEAGFTPKQTTRKANYVTYFKSSETIADFLTALGAPISAMELINAKLEKHLRGSVNRRVNCDSANLDKAVDAALEQVEAIERFARTRGLDALPDKLRQTAELRLAHPELTLSQLSALFDPPVTKSCLNHRLRKLMELAGEG
ncbi:MAG TPA: DNA-binding protein WhiA [Candidatus Intestinimonas stercoravium]|uniref:DNA-binding protein WhiA n=1 Tax=uncultured Intestinimonas sp. TaxID=1689265 RepID=UPI001F84C832|nr:DNA-binding protein WhiA [uncultured Intestinimonas sp.]HJA63932.1 DNA-binding protein WhiA [Candidatus Intestinimonas stercoravium]